MILPFPPQPVEASPAKLRLAFEAAPFGRLVEMAGGRTSDGVSGNSVLDMRRGQIDHIPNQENPWISRNIL